MTDVFLCYSRRDLEFVRSLAEALRERAADTFLDLGEWWYDDASREQSANSGDVSAVGLPDRALSHPASDSAVASANKTGLEAGYEPNAGARMDEVHAAIRGATSVLAVVSPDLAASARCRHEIERAAVLHKHIVAVSARPTPLASLPPQLRQCAASSRCRLRTSRTGWGASCGQSKATLRTSASGHRCTGGVGRCWASWH